MEFSYSQRPQGWNQKQKQLCFYKRKEQQPDSKSFSPTVIKYILGHLPFSLWTQKATRMCLTNRKQGVGIFMNLPVMKAVLQIVGASHTLIWTQITWGFSLELRCWLSKPEVGFKILPKTWLSNNDQEAGVMEKKNDWVFQGEGPGVWLLQDGHYNHLILKPARVHLKLVSTAYPIFFSARSICF